MKKGIILAAGLGKRMGGKYPKVLFPIKDKPIITVLLTNIKNFFEKIIVVIGFKGELVKEEILKHFTNIDFVVQEKQIGTADAVKCALSQIDEDDDIFILNGDVPLLTQKTLEDMYNFAQKTESDIVVGIMKIENPFGYGRIIMENNIIRKIVEEKDATEEEKKINLVNGGLYYIKGSILLEYLNKIDNNNAQKEYYLTDIVKIVNKAGKKISGFVVKNNTELLGINTPEQLKEVEKYVQ